jgi:hypothetical protein
MGRNRFWLTAILAAFFVFSLPALTILGLRAFGRYGATPEILLPVLLIAGVVSLLGAIALVTLTYGRYGLTDRTQPLALPEGSVRAIIAMLLILIFAIVAVFLFSQLFRGQVVTRQLTQDELQALPPDTKIITSTEQADGSLIVKMSLPATLASQDFAKQLLTTMSTLVVALAAFYFGTQATRAAVEAVQGRPGPALELDNPTSPATLPGPGAKTNILLRPSPYDAEVSGEIVSGGGELNATSPTSFEYTAKPAPQERVVLRFALRMFPDQIAYVELLPSPSRDQGREEEAGTPGTATE